ncbi:hypothetical protein Barb6_03041 [Bacteroidales bacterium Barb6]|nr:hypothetical protein Barb6_03041 [Bacteroidales bacterium Barb6]
MLRLILSDEFEYWQTGIIETEYSYYFRRPYPTPEIAHFSIDFTDSLQITTDFFTQSLINPIQINQAFMTLVAQANAQSGQNFDNLFVPFRCVASDIYNKKAVVFKQGDLAQAVRASMSLPLVFQPVWMDSIPLFDGGLYDNFPVKPMKEDFHPGYIFGSAVVGMNQSKVSDNAYNQIETMIMQKTDYQVPSGEGVMLHMSFPNTAVFDFHHGKEVMEEGYRRTLALIDSVKQSVTRRVTPQELADRRKAYKESLPPLLFRNIYINGVTKARQKYIEAQLDRDINGTFTPEDFKRAYFKILAYSKIKEIMPRAIYNPQESTFDLHLDVKMHNEYKATFGGNISSHQANQLFLGIQHQMLGNLASDLHANLHVGKSFNGAMLDGRIYLQSSVPAYINLRTVFSSRHYTESNTLFYEDLVPAIIRQNETYAKLIWGLPFLDQAKAEIGVAYGQQHDRYLQSAGNILTQTDKFDQSLYNLLVASLGIETNTLNHPQYPTAGTQKYLVAHYANSTEHYHPPIPVGPKSHADPHPHIPHTWLQMQSRILQYHSLTNRLTLGYLAEITLSSKDLMGNYTAAILQAPAFTPTPHSRIAFNEKYRANQYAALGLTPIFKTGKRLTLRLDLCAFAPLYEIQKPAVQPQTAESPKPTYGSFLAPRSFQYIAEAALVLRVSALTVSLFANAYSHPARNFNFGLNIGTLLFNPKLLE